MRLAITVGLLASLSAAHLAAQEAKPRPEIIIGSDKQHAPPAEKSCVEIEINGEKSPDLDCLNRKLRGDVDKVQTPSIAAPLDAKSQDIRLGIVNPSAIQQQFGRNYGTSAAPQRPTPVYGLSGGRH